MLNSARPIVDRVGNALLSPPRTIFSHYTNQGPSSRRQIAFTFDDGPSEPSTRYLLDALDEYGVSATFFVVGSMALKHPELVRSAFERGHVIGSHSMHHRRRSALHPIGASHIDECSSLLREIIGASPSIYRPPWGWLTPWEALRLSKRGLTPIGWDVYPDDWMVPEVPVNILVEQVTSQVRPGSIVLMHDGRAVYPDCSKTNTAQAIRPIVERLTEAGYEFVTVSEMLGIAPYLR